jgi:hypothetical protein
MWEASDSGSDRMVANPEASCKVAIQKSTHHPQAEKIRAMALVQGAELKSRPRA